LTNVLETERLTLRRLTITDAPFMLGLLNEASFLRYIGDRGVRNLDDARRYIIDGPVASYERFGFGLYLANLKPDGTAIGICGLLKRDYLEDADIGFAFLPQYWRCGYAFESAMAVMEHARRDFGLRRLAAITSVENAASIRVLEKMGLRFERMLRPSPDAAEVRLFACSL
jgi:ribosomal-protein-alanine N-acetyltransferase